jgi:hypothetical protein
MPPAQGGKIQPWKLINMHGYWNFNASSDTMLNACSMFDMAERTNPMEIRQLAAVSRQGDVQRRHGGRPWPKGTSGNPSGSRVNTRAKVLFDELATDFGGVNGLSAVDRTLLLQACRLMARAARAKDADVVVRLTSEARRILASLQKRAAPQSSRGPSLAQYLAAREAAAPMGALEGAAAEEVAAGETNSTSEALEGNAAASLKGDDEASA